MNFHQLLIYDTMFHRYDTTMYGLRYAIRIHAHDAPSLSTPTFSLPHHNSHVWLGSCCSLLFMIAMLAALRVAPAALLSHAEVMP